MFRRSLQIVAVLALTWAPSVASALMPPHTTDSDPKDGGDLQGRTVTFQGYSLDYAEKKADVIDLRGNRRVPATVEVECRWQGKGDCPGCQQQRCEARVTLAAVEKDHRYRITYLDLTITVRAVTSELGGTRPVPLDKPKAAPPAEADKPKAPPPAEADRPKAPPPPPGPGSKQGAANAARPSPGTVQTTAVMPRTQGRG